MELTDLKHLFDYTEWANNLAMEGAVALPDSDLRRDFGISHKSIFGTLLHMAGAEWIWLERWHGRSPVREEAWPRWSEESCADLDELRERWNQVVKQRQSFVAELDASKLLEQQHFKLLNGEASSMRLSHQMQHVVNHATMHRGQVVGMIRQLGINPPATDLLFYVRQQE
jgi:uncharacterized damage-inducible protein DinB